MTKPDAHFERLAISRYEEIKKLRQQISDCNLECEEQARLNGMGSEREARLLARVAELEQVIKSHGIPVKTYSGGKAHYCTGAEE